MKPMIKVYLAGDDGEKIFGEGPCRLLLAVRATGSVRQAAMEQEMAYTKALKILNRAEAALGYPLITRSAGGRSGGGSRLTPKGEAVLAAYERYRDRCREECGRIYQEIFSQESRSAEALGCIIMASGRGKRFGGNKLMADFLGRPMLCRALDATEGLFAKRVVVTRHEDVAELCRKQGVSVLLHSEPDRSDTVRLGLEQLGEDIRGCLFCPGDQPLLSRESVERMANEAEGEHILRLAWEDRPGAPVLFPRRYFPELLDLPQGCGGSFVIKKYPGLVRNIQAREEAELWDADTPEALEELKKILSF